ncbi:MAG TPA: PhoD-like phosphatase N-terminal domain-containing protein, partial [Rubrobacter sp.]|nr:PhoD-like phosphatase N-terminal domain-containing protein [Rubrobacter sp.]
MSIEGNWNRRISRRTFLSGAAGATGLILISGVPARAKPSGSPSGLPTITHGVQSGDVTASSAIVWARADRPSRMFAEVAATESFRRPKVYKGPITDAAT